MYEMSIVDPLKDITKDITGSFQILQKQLENVCEITKGNMHPILEKLAGVSKGKQLTTASTQFLELDKILNPIPEVSAKSILPTLPSFNFSNIIIPRPSGNSISPLVPEDHHTPITETDSTTITSEVTDKRIFIGHGRSDCWKELKDFFSTDLRLSHDEFNRVPTAGLPTSERLQQMLEKSEIAFLIMTAENQYANGTWHARENVIHEIGLFQAKLGFKKAIILLEEGCEEFSNISGLGQIRFPKGNIKAVFEEIRQVLEREGVI